MPSRLTLRHLAFVGPFKSLASVEFGPDQTYITGPSNTGKSYIADAIAFIFGARSLRAIPESEGYTSVILCITLNDGSLVSLIRGVDSNRIAVHEGAWKTLPDEPPSRTLSFKNSRRSMNNVSQYLLGETDLIGVKVRTNVRNETRPASWREVARLCLVDELSMQETRSPILSQYPANNTAERSLFRVLLEGTDDSDLEPTAAAPEARRLSRSNVALIDDLLTSLFERLEGAPSMPELEQQLERLRGSITTTMEGQAVRTRERDRLLEVRTGVTEELRKLRDRASEVDALRTRFGLLGQQYSSDLDRLATVREAGQLLGYFRPGVCVFCGAEVEHQNPTTAHVAAEVTDIAEAVSSEVGRTETLRADLLLTLSDLERQREQLATDVETQNDQLAEIDRALALLDRDDSATDTPSLSELLDSRSRVERLVDLHSQVETLLERRDLVELASDSQSGPVRTTTRATTARFSTVLRDTAAQLGIPDAETLTFDPEADDVATGAQRRASHGKGMRALLHATFNIALSEYCISADLPHPGFVILDSPVLTYRGPDSPPDARDDDFVGQDVAASFFANMHAATSAQVIVMENIEPPTDIPDSARVVHFTKSPDDRYGLFPPIPDS